MPLPTPQVCVYASKSFVLSRNFAQVFGGQNWNSRPHFTRRDFNAKRQMFRQTTLSVIHSQSYLAVHRGKKRKPKRKKRYSQRSQGGALSIILFRNSQCADKTTRNNDIKYRGLHTVRKGELSWLGWFQIVSTLLSTSIVILVKIFVSVQIDK